MLVKDAGVKHGSSILSFVVKYPSKSSWSKTMSRQVAVERFDRPHSLPGSSFRATNLDLVLATIIALGLPFACQWLFAHTGGAVASLLLYYGVCCVAVVSTEAHVL
jgi:hypothetical protein